MRAFNVRFTVERRDFTRHAWGKTLAYALMRTDETTMKSTTKKKGREEDELMFKGTVEPFYSSAHPVTPAVLYHRLVVLLRFVSCFHCFARSDIPFLCDACDALSLTL